MICVLSKFQALLRPFLTCFTCKNSKYRYLKLTIEQITLIFSYFPNSELYKQ